MIADIPIYISMFQWSSKPQKPCMYMLIRNTRQWCHLMSSDDQKELISDSSILIMIPLTHPLLHVTKP